MRVLLCHRPQGAFGYISDGWLNALRSVGHQAGRWDGARASWDAFDPDLYVGCSGHRQPVPEDRRAAVAVHVNPYGLESVPGIDESKSNIDWTLAQRPTAVFGYGHEGDRHLWFHWTARHGIPWAPMPTAADTVVYGPGVGAKSYDLAYVGGRWAYKGRTIDSYLLPALRSGKFTYKLFGWGEWPDGVSSGAIDDDRVAGLLHSGRVGPCMSEPHTQSHGFDLPERVFKVAACGTLPVHDKVPGLDRYIPELPVATGPKDFEDLLFYWSREASTEDLAAMASRVTGAVLAAHTYHHRMATLLAACGFPLQAAGMTAGKRVPA